MSDILIKGMEMPKNCQQCSLIHSSWGVDFYCVLAKDYQDFDFIQSHRMPSCPLIELPPHGRLIDADKLNIHDVSPAYGFCVMGVTEEDIELAEAVIEAEGETDGR